LIVVDASIAAAWLLAEKNFSPTNDLLDLLSRESLLVPPHWPTEVGNAIRRAVRMRRVLTEDVELLVATLKSLDISVTTPPAISEVGGLVHFALDNNLSVYDAAYVRLAAARQMPLATLDTTMKAAARKIGVATLPA
jgi:predicted nucleic acid-binding protein